MRVIRVSRGILVLFGFESGRLDVGHRYCGLEILQKFLHLLELRFSDLYDFGIFYSCLFLLLPLVIVIIVVTTTFVVVVGCRELATDGSAIDRLGFVYTRIIKIGSWVNIWVNLTMILT